MDLDKQRMKREKEIELEKIEKDFTINKLRQDKAAELKA